MPIAEIYGPDDFAKAHRAHAAQPQQLLVFDHHGQIVSKSVVAPSPLSPFLLALPSLSQSSVESCMIHKESIQIYWIFNFLAIIIESLNVLGSSENRISR